MEEMSPCECRKQLSLPHLRRMEISINGNSIIKKFVTINIEASTRTMMLDIIYYLVACDFHCVALDSMMI